MASHAVVDRKLAVAGLIFCSFPLHEARAAFELDTRPDAVLVGHA
jgi:hypothetical protein